jgi:hypothetical protein
MLIGMTVEVYYVIERKQYLGTRGDVDDYEWVELPNSTSSQPIDMSGKQAWRCVRVTIKREVI